MKIGLALFCFTLFGYFAVPAIYHAMKANDYNHLQNGFQNTKKAGGSFVDEKKHFKSYADKFMSGNK